MTTVRRDIRVLCSFRRLLLTGMDHEGESRRTTLKLENVRSLLVLVCATNNGEFGSVEFLTREEESSREK